MFSMMFTLTFYLHNKKMVFFFKPTAVRTIYAKYSKSSQLYKISHYSLKIRVNIIQNYYFCSAQKKKVYHAGLKQYEVE